MHPTGRTAGNADDSVLHGAGFAQVLLRLRAGCSDTGSSAAVADNMARSTALTLIMHRPEQIDASEQENAQKIELQVQRLMEILQNMGVALTSAGGA